MSYALYQPMIRHAQARPALWRLILGVITAVAVAFLWMAGIVFLLGLVWGVGFGAAIPQVFGQGADAAWRAILYLLIVAGLGLGTLVAAAAWQGRGRASLIGPGARALRHFAVAAAVTAATALALSLIPSGTDDAIERNLPLSTWLFWLPFALVALAAQTGAEELFFRCYLQSQLAARFRWPLVWLAVPAVAFGFAHYVPGLPGNNALLYVAFAITFGILAGDLTARTGSLGAAWGWHFANNSIAVLVVATEGSVTGLGFWKTETGLTEAIPISFWLLTDLAVVLVVWLVIRRLLRV
ncbi:MAG: type II CAAX endopeptidase family protein [Paracoccaceae bacterium]|nr:type II CAAX endopeptidase family protein [Paracoccaceae bacterium]